MKPLEINTRTEGNATVVTVSGHIAGFEAEVLSAPFVELIEAKALLVIVDLAGVELITSDGLGVLIRSRKAVAEYGGRLVLCGLEGNVLDVFKMTRLDKVFSMYETTGAALAAADG